MSFGDPVSTTIVFALMAIAIALMIARYRRIRCPHCGSRKLKMLNGIRATINVNGQRAPDSWIYYQCRNCQALLKWHREQMSDTPPEEAKRYGLLEVCESIDHENPH